MAVDLDQDLLRSERLRPIKDAREEARRIERRADQADSDNPDEGESLLSTPHWRTVRDLAEKAIDEQAKDLEIAAYLIEALVRLESFAGLHRGFKIVRDLVEQSWDQLYPMPDEYDGISARVLPLARLNGEEGEGFLIGPINRVPITQGDTWGPYGYWQQQQVNEFNKFSDRDKQARAERGEATPERLKQAVGETDPNFYRSLLGDLVNCITEYDALNQALDEKCGKDDHGHSLAPPSSAVRNLLEQVLLGVKAIAKDRLPPETIASAATNGAVAAVGAAGGAVVPSGGIQNREDAFHLLSMAAEFFERTEPQSLLPAQIRKAIRWGRLTPDQYYRELIEDQHVVEQIFKQMGLPLGDPSQQS